MTEKAFQDYYKDDYSMCYGCGRLNPVGLQIKSYWEGDESVCRFMPRPEHIALPGYVYGGLIASLIDCHGTGTAAASAFRDEGRSMDSEPSHRFVTASLHVDYLRPTPIDTPIDLRGRIKETFKGRYVITVEVFSGDQLCARGEVVAAPMPKRMQQSS